MSHNFSKNAKISIKERYFLEQVLLDYSQLKKNSDELEGGYVYLEAVKMNYGYAVSMKIHSLPLS